MNAPLLVSVPHGGWRVAEEIKNIWALKTKDAFHDGDPFTSRIYDFSDRVEVHLVMEYFRAVVDLNRRPDDIAPANPDGVIKSHTCYNIEVYQPDSLPDEALKKILLERYYFPYHAWLDKAMSRSDIKLGVDCHSMAAVAPPIEANAGEPRPLICLGNLGGADGHEAPPFKRLTCPPDMLRFMADEFSRAFQHEDVELDVPSIASMNVPFSGGYITQRVGGGPIPFVQIEMSRALYLSPPWFQVDSLEIDENRIRYLNEKVWYVLSKTLENL